MATADILSLLIAERDKLDRAITTLQGPARRRGRPPKARAGMGTAPTGPRRRGGMSRAARLAQSKRMTAFWAARRKTARATAAKPQRRSHMSAQARKRQSERMTALWAARRKAKARAARAG